MNLFRKHLKRVFGKEQYKQYFLICKVLSAEKQQEI